MIKVIANAAMNLPKTISNSRKGDVSNNSRVPSFCSSAIRRMVRAGDMKIMKKIAPAKYPRMLASANASDTDATKKNPVMAKNAADTTYAIGDEKYVRISLIAITEMKRNVYSSKFSSVVSSRKISSSVIGRGVRFVRPHPFSIIDFAICSDAWAFGLASTMKGLKSSLSDL